MMRYKLLGKTGLKVSELCLGTMTFGEEWGSGANKTESKKMFDAFTQQGGNFIDTANRYTEGTSERFLGDFIAHDRDAFVIATKYTLYDRTDDLNAAGNSRKNLMRSVEGSLKRLNTEYIDLLWLHAWDFTTPVEEVMRGLDDLVSAGKVHYIGISDTPAWIVAKANTMAQLRGWASFAALQIEYSLIERTPERELLPMAKDFGMAITPWSPLGAGVLTGKYNQGMIGGARLSEKSVKFNERNLEIAREVDKIAYEIGVKPLQVALKWLMQQHAQIIPIVGARNAAQLQDSLDCIQLTLSEEHLNRLDEVSKISLGFPHEFLASPNVKKVAFGGNYEKIDF